MQCFLANTNARGGVGFQFCGRIFNLGTNIIYEVSGLMILLSAREVTRVFGVTSTTKSLKVVGPSTCSYSEIFSEHHAVNSLLNSRNSRCHVLVGLTTNGSRTKQ